MINAYRLHIPPPANDNRTTYAWVNAMRDGPFVEFWLHEDPHMLYALKNRWYGGVMKDDEAAENRIGNFIWFMRFEMSFLQDERNPKRNFKPEVVK